MSDSKNIEIDGIPVVLIRSKRSKRINISMAPFSGVRVAVPNSSSFIKAEQFARTKMNWIKKHHQKIKYFEEKYAHEQKNTVYKDVNKTEAQLILTDRLQLLADKYGFSYGKVSIRNQKTRWGSCSCKNNISLNMKLIRLPEELMDYVILHELVHTKVKNHSPAFWIELDKLVGNSKKMRSRLKNYGTGLYI